MMILNTYLERRGKGHILIFELPDLKKEIREGIVFVMKAKTLMEIALRKRNLLINIYVVFNQRQRRFVKFKRVSLVTRSSKSSTKKR